MKNKTKIYIRGREIEVTSDNPDKIKEQLRSKQITKSIIESAREMKKQDESRD